jgi:predicted dehydrogenase
LGIGKVHARTLAAMDDVELNAVADVRGDLAGQVAGECSCRAYGSGEELIAAEDLDLISICTNPASHLQLTEHAARRGVHVLVEKPMAPTLADCDGMIDACAKAGVKLMVAQKKRFEPAYRFVREQSAGEFGPARWATVKYALGRVDKEWFWDEDDGGGPLHENTIHMFDMLRFLMGEPDRVYAEGGNLFNPDYKRQIDVAAATIRFQDGGMAAVGAGQASEWGFATEHMALSHDNAVVEVNGKFDSPYNLRYVLKSDPGNIVERDFGGFDPFAAELTHFADCVREDLAPAVPGEEARASVALCLAVKESVRTGKVVEL